MSVVDIDSYENWQAALRETDTVFRVVFFWADWHEPSQPGGQMDQVFKQLYTMYSSNTKFMKIEAEAVPEISEELEIEVVPTFVLMKGKLNGRAPIE